MSVEVVAGCGHRHRHRTDVVLANALAQPDVFGAFLAQELDPHADHEKLPNFFLDRQRAQGVLSPVLSDDRCRRWWDRRAMLVARERRSTQKGKEDDQGEGVAHRSRAYCGNKWTSSTELVTEG